MNERGHPPTLQHVPGNTAAVTHGVYAAGNRELGAFARESAAALTALDSYAVGIGIAEVLDAARTGHRHATLVLDIGRRLPGLAPTTVAADDELAGLYAGLAEGGDVPPRLVSHAGELLRAAPKRTDRELLRAVVDAAGVRSRIEQLIAPRPLPRWPRSRRSAPRNSQVLQSSTRESACGPGGARCRIARPDCPPSRTSAGARLTTPVGASAAITLQVHSRGAST